MCSVVDEYGYQDDDIVMLTDDQMNPRSIPTRMNMVSRRILLSWVYAPYLWMHLTIFQIHAFQWLVRDAQPNDSLFLHCMLQTFTIYFMS